MNSAPESVIGSQVEEDLDAILKGVAAVQAPTTPGWFDCNCRFDWQAKEGEVQQQGDDAKEYADEIQS